MMRMESEFTIPPLLKPRIVLTLIYSAGLRSQEAINLKLTDIDSKESYNQLVTIFPGIEISPFQTIEKVFTDVETPQIEIDEKVTPLPEVQSLPIKNEIVIELSGKRLFLKMPKNETDIQLVRTFKYIRWDNAHLKWIIPNYGKNLELIKNYFNTRITRLETCIKNQPKIFPIAALTVYVTDLPRLDPESVHEIEQFRHWMEQKRYSESTVSTYIMAITVSLRFVKPKTSSEVENTDMQRFVYQYMIPRKLSFSYQNQVHSVGLKKETQCIVIIKGSLLITEKLERPRSEHNCPMY